MAFYFMPDELVGHIVSGILGGREPFYRNIIKEITTTVISAYIIYGLPLNDIDADTHAFQDCGVGHEVNAAWQGDRPIVRRSPNKNLCRQCLRLSPQFLILTQGFDGFRLRCRRWMRLRFETSK
jgi:hypothetical protein